MLVRFHHGGSEAGVCSGKPAEQRRTAAKAASAEQRGRCPQWEGTSREGGRWEGEAGGLWAPSSRLPPCPSPGLARIRVLSPFHTEHLHFPEAGRLWRQGQGGREPPSLLSWECHGEDAHRSLGREELRPLANSQVRQQPWKRLLQPRSGPPGAQVQLTPEPLAQVWTGVSRPSLSRISDPQKC